MTSSGTSSTADQAKTIRDLLSGRHVCPFCGGQRANATVPCPRCTMDDTPQTRQATVARVGPWFVLQSKNPSAPGMRWATLIALARKGQIGPRTVVRGPVTQQLWAFAAKVRGLSRELGVCHDCGDAIGKAAATCNACGTSQEPPMNPDALLDSPLAGLLQSAGPTDRDLSLRLAEPTAIASIRRENRPRPAAGLTSVPNDAILSASELAAAFQLGVDGLHRRRRVRGVLAMLCVLAILGAATYVYIDPVRRESAIEWVQLKWEQYRPKPAVESSPELSILTHTTIPSAINPSATQPTTAAVPSTMPTVELIPNPAGRPAVPEPATVPSLPSTTKPAELVPPPVVEPTPPTPEPAPPKPTVPEEPPLTRSRRLYRAAIDATGSDDTLALKLLEEIRTLPKSVHPGDLDLRINQLRRKLGRQ